MALKRYYLPWSRLTKGKNTYILILNKSRANSIYKHTNTRSYNKGYQRMVKDNSTLYKKTCMVNKLITDDN